MTARPSMAPVCFATLAPAVALRRAAPTRAGRAVCVAARGGGGEAPPERVDAEFVRLGGFLKAAGVAGTGGQAKLLVQGGGVRVNGAVETRRGKKLVAGDVVEVPGEGVRIAVEFE